MWLFAFQRSLGTATDLVTEVLTWAAALRWIALLR